MSQFVENERSAAQPIELDILNFLFRVIKVLNINGHGGQVFISCETRTYLVKKEETTKLFTNYQKLFVINIFINKNLKLYWSNKYFSIFFIDEKNRDQIWLNSVDQNCHICRWFGKTGLFSK